MKMFRPNNPVFADSVSLDVWRDDFSLDDGCANLYIDLVFTKGRITGKSDDGRIMVHFKLLLRKAVLHVLESGSIDFPPEYVTRELPEYHNLEKRVSMSRGWSIAGSFNSLIKIVGRAGAEKESEIIMTEEGRHANMSTITRKDREGYSISIQNSVARTLLGRPWAAEKSRFRARDIHFRRKKGEPPEVVVELRCKREDLEIIDIEFPGQNTINWIELSDKKKTIVEQYIKQELIRLGFPDVDMGDSFSEFMLAVCMSRSK